MARVHNVKCAYTWYGHDHRFVWAKQLSTYVYWGKEDKSFNCLKLHTTQVLRPLAHIKVVEIVQRRRKERKRGREGGKKERERAQHNVISH